MARNAARVLAATVAVAFAALIGADAAPVRAPGEPAGPGTVTAPFRPGAAGAGDTYFPDYGNGGYDVERYALDLRYDPASDRLDGRAVLTMTATANLSRFNLDFGHLEITTLAVNGSAAEWRREDRHELVITPSAGLPAGGPFRVEVAYGGRPGGAADSAFRHTADGAFVAGEPESATEWFPANDHPADKASYDFAITVPDGLTAVANGVPAGSEAHDGWRTWRWRQEAPMASYLATLAMGRFRVYQATHNGLPVFSAVDAALPESRADAAIARSPEIVDFLAGRFGPYPFEALGGIVIAADVGFALETQTRPVYGPRFFERGSVDDKTSVIVHELAHQWFGDSVSLRQWRDIWLNEGFATYAQWLWDEHLGRRTVQQAFYNAYAAPAGSRVWAPPPGDPGANALFAASVYQRGAMTVHALRTAVGDDAFFRILRAWTTERRHATGTTADFIALAERISGRELDGLFAAWLFTADKPPHPGE